jgi:hypothetical protein
MITSENALKFLGEQKKIKLKRNDFSSYSSSYKTLGLILSGIHLKYGSYSEDLATKYIKLFGNDFSSNPWLTHEGNKLAKLLYGDIRAPYISLIWELINNLPFQTGYYRRSFRNKVGKTHLENKLSTLQILFQSGSSQGFAYLPFSEQIRYCTYTPNQAHAFLFSVVIDSNNESLDELITDIINGEDEVGGITQELVKALLLSKNYKNWELVGKLLLAAQRQEGLRQTILECLDETQIGALKYMIHLILDNDLMRFSSVIRAVDTWFGFGWDAPKKSTIKRILEVSLKLMEDSTLIKESLNSKDFLEVYVALWVIALENTDAANEQAFEILLNNTNKDHKLLALFFMHETRRTNTKLLDYMQAEIGKDVELDHWMLLNTPEFEVDENMFDAIKSIADSLPIKGKRFDGRVFSWISYTIKPYDFYRTLIQKADHNHLENLSGNISKIPSEARDDYMRKIFPDHYQFGTYGMNLEKPKKLITKNLGWKRSVIHQAIVDRNDSVMSTGINLLNSMDVDEPELSLIESILSRKNKYLRRELITLVLGLEEYQIIPLTTNLLQANKLDQRLAGLEVLVHLHEKTLYSEFVSAEVDKYLLRKKFNNNEQVFLDKFDKKEQDFSFSNGFGAIDYNNLSPLIIPQKIFETESNNRIITQFVDEEKTCKQINRLIDIYKENKNHEYQYVSYGGEKCTTLLSEHVSYTSDVESATEIQKLQSLPLSDLWINWYKDSDLNDMELVCAFHFASNIGDPFGNPYIDPYLRTYIPNLKKLNFDNDYFNPLTTNIRKLLEALINVNIDFTKINQIKTDLLEDAIANFPLDLKSKNLGDPKWGQVDLFWFGLIMSQPFFMTFIDKYTKRFWELCRYLTAQNLGYPEHITSLKEVVNNTPKSYLYEGTSEETTIPLYYQGIATKDDLLLEALMSENHKFSLDANNAPSSVRTRVIEHLNPPFGILKQLKKNLLTIELKRGDVETEASKYINRFYSFNGMEYLLETLGRMGKSVFDSGYSYYNDTSKSSTFSYIIKNCKPKDTDTYEEFVSKIEEAKINKQRLLEVACYAVQWSKWIGKYLKIEKLTSAVWWFHAHSSEYMNAEKETEISRYSNIPINNFERGSLDIDWFNDIYASLGKANWKMLHHASKYISNGHAARQVKLYSSVLLGEVKITETLKKIKEKRDQIFVRSLGLVPLSKMNPEADLLKRYNILQNYLKESKQFGSQRQESEKTAVEIGLENLSRNAGYSDSVRFGWAMESKAAQEIMQNSHVVIDNVEINLDVDEQGKSYFKVLKGGKSQKSIPAKYNKNKNILQLKQNKSYLTKQYSRTRLSLEKAMLNEDVFSLKEMENIIKHPVVKPMLKILVLLDINNQVSGFWNSDSLLDTQLKKHQLNSESRIVIAHPAHLHKLNIWSNYQRYLFDEKISQPFKQVFRELYIVTKDENENHNRSHRYQGHQIQPKKTAALLRSRGWTLNYEEGLQKVYHKQGFMASMYAMADWYSPSDVEAPTLEYVAFSSISDYKSIPLNEINPLIFSEVMRDIDLVVSVAHVGGVDPEASHSTMEMRVVLARESARLFKLDNVEVKQRHILVKGKLGNYGIHLGSGNVSKNGLSLSIIPVHSQHRGRLFLPFVDDDPKSAEIISKMKLLAEDNKIQDPTILAQINK